jgi:UDP-N-acetylmuramate: L-alanyl-gamma-D-glutamyl-meso-diaminopimelate ligase
MHYHLMGIAGVAMGSLAGLLRAKGHVITGSDEGVYPPMSTLLDDLGIAYARSFTPANLEPAPDVVVVGNAISRGNEELEAVLDRGIPYVSAASLIRDELLAGKHVLAVAGTHGKTTTASILAWLLERAGLAPSFLIGGVAENFGASFRLTDSDLFVIEADEYDTAYFDKGPKMWHYRPRTAVVTNVEFDHADIYRDEIAYRFAFERFVNLVPRTGTLVLGLEGAIERDLADRSWAPVESFAIRGGQGGATGGAHPRWRATDVTYGPSATTFSVVHDDRPLGPVETPLAGAFNVRNCLGALAAAHAVGADWEALTEGLRTFESVRRRLEVRGEPGGVTVIDDFAHHPTAVRETLAAARQRYPGRRLIAVLEPRNYTSQTHAFQERFRQAFGQADRVILAALFRPERYDEHTAMNPAELVEGLRSDGVRADYIPAVDDIVADLASTAESRDVVILMSNGGFGGIHGKLLEALHRRGPRAGGPGPTSA